MAFALIVGHHMGEETLAAALATGAAAVPAVLLVVRARLDRLAQVLRLRRSRG